VENFLCQANIAFCAARAGVIGEDRLAEAGCFGEADAPGNDGRKHSIAEKFSQVRRYLARKVGAVVIHGEKNTGDFQRMLKGRANPVNRIHKLRNALEGKELALDGDKDLVGCNKGVKSEEVQGGRTIDDDEGIPLANRLDAIPKTKLTIGQIDQFEVGADEILVGRDDVETSELGADDGILGERIAEEDVVEARAARILRHTQSGGGVSLWIGVDEQDFDFTRSQ